jgi:hypothetical protein
MIPGVGVAVRRSKAVVGLFLMHVCVSAQR